MAGQIRVLAESDSKAPLAEIRTMLGPEFALAVQDGDEANWERVSLAHFGDAEIAVVHRQPVEAGSRAALELRQLFLGLEGARPTSAAEWLKRHLHEVKAIYGVQVLLGAEDIQGWNAIQRIQAYLWRKFGGILQADDEGFTNREGQHILWQFHGPQQGELEVAVLDEAGKWVPFTVDMADQQQVERFLRGEVIKVK
jgi:hypothetical protein